MLHLEHYSQKSSVKVAVIQLLSLVLRRAKVVPVAVLGMDDVATVGLVVVIVLGAAVVGFATRSVDYPAPGCPAT